MKEEAQVKKCFVELEVKYLEQILGRVVHCPQILVQCFSLLLYMILKTPSQCHLFPFSVGPALARSDCFFGMLLVTTATLHFQRDYTCHGKLLRIRCESFRSSGRLSKRACFSLYHPTPPAALILTLLLCLGEMRGRVV